MATLESLPFDNSALRALPTDQEEKNYVRTVPGERPGCRAVAPSSVWVELLPLQVASRPRPPLSLQAPATLACAPHPSRTPHWSPTPNLLSTSSPSPPRRCRGLSFSSTSAAVRFCPGQNRPPTATVATSLATLLASLETAVLSECLQHC